MHLRKLILFLTTAACMASPLAHGAQRQPNFLFVYTDDQRWDAIGVVQREQGEHGRYPWFQTPNMDRLAAEGVRFLTGRYNHLNGVANNHTPFPVDSVTHATLLHAAGYTTAYIGKWHMDGQRGQRPGFDYSASFVGQGKYWDCPVEINGKPTETKGWVDDVDTDYAIDFIKEHRDKPFSMVVGFKACHGPFDPPERAKERFEGMKARSVPNFNVDAIYADPTAQKKQRSYNASEATNLNAEVSLRYFRCISAADDNLGRLLKALEEANILENTVVIFSSDNGYYQGEHGLGDKRSAYDESLRIPMLVRYPKSFAKGKVLDQMVLNIDLAPTLLELAGVPVPSVMQGRSWVPLLTGKKTDWRKSFLFEYFLENAFPNTPTVFGVRTETAKLLKYPGHEEWTELFDLNHDPFETHNLATQDNSLLTQMRGELEKQMKTVDFKVPDYADKGDGAVKKAAKKKGKKAAEE